MSTIAAHLDSDTHEVRVRLTRAQFDRLRELRTATLAQFGMAPGTLMILRWLIEIFDADATATRWELDVRDALGGGT